MFCYSSAFGVSALWSKESFFYAHGLNSFAQSLLDYLRSEFADPAAQQHMQWTGWTTGGSYILVIQQIAKKKCQFMHDSFIGNCYFP